MTQPKPQPPMRIGAVISEAIDVFIDAGERFELSQVTGYARKAHPDVIRTYTVDLVEGQLQKLAAGQLRGRSVTKKRPQTSRLPGFPAPDAIFVPEKKGSTTGNYIGFSAAVWAELLLHRAVVAANAEHVIDLLRDLDEKLEKLKPVMEADPEMTEAEAEVVLYGKLGDDDDPDGAPVPDDTDPPDPDAPDQGGDSDWEILKGSDNWGK